MFFTLMITFAVFYAINFWLSGVQMKHFAAEYGVLRKRGRVAMGKNQRLLSAGAITMLLIDKEGTILDGSVLKGVTVFSQFRKFADFNGRNLGALTLEEIAERHYSKGLRLSVENARSNYITVLNGGIPQDPPGPLSRIADRFSSLIHSKRKEQA